MRLLSRAACALLLLLPLIGAGPAHADGTVYRASGCGDRIYVATRAGYSVLLTDGASGVKDGDALRGDVETIGHPILFDTSAERSVFGEVAERQLTLSDVTRRVAAHCRSPLGETIASGYVSRAAGCGSRIFINTPQGYAVLERIAGGIVADGDTLVGNFNRPGQATVEDRQSGTSLVVFVEDLWLPRSAAERKIAASCRRP
jgi:hypothetical protein